MKADARVWKVKNKETCKATVNAPYSSCSGFYSMTVQVVHGENKHESDPFYGPIALSISTSGPKSDLNYAAAYISDHNTNSPHYSESESDTDYGEG